MRNLSIQRTGVLSFWCQPNNKGIIILIGGIRIRGGSVNICDAAPSLKVPYKNPTFI